MTVNDTGRWAVSAILLSTAISSSGGPDDSGLSWNTPAPADRRPSASARSSPSAASTVGAGVPSLARWNSERDVLTPMAPALIPSVTRSAIWRRSTSVETSRRTARSPMTYTRIGECGICTPTSTSKCRAATASMYSGNVSQFHGRPSVITSSGMSSTPSITVISFWRSSARHGAKPTPQFPVITVVAPCSLDGAIRCSHVT